jgi:hypothetical protein
MSTATVVGSVAAVRAKGVFGARMAVELVDEAP